MYQYGLFYYSILDPSLYYQDDILAFNADTETDFQSGILNGTDTSSYEDRHKSNPENPS